MQRLRYKVFIEEMGLTSMANNERLDHDEYDDYCDHLIVRDCATIKVIGTYRMLSPQAARKARRFYSEQEFDLGRLANLRGRIAEAGRACIHPKYRSGTVILMLWAGIAAFMKKEKCDYLIGCASLSLADGGHNAAALYHAITQTNRAPSDYRVKPQLQFPMDRNTAAMPAAPGVPPLIKGYLRSGLVAMDLWRAGMGSGFQQCRPVHDAAASQTG